MTCLLQVEFWPGRGINTALASAHLAAVTLLTSMTHDPAQPCFAPSLAHLAHFSRQMTDMADQLRAHPSMDVLAIPPPGPRWSEVAAKTPEEVVHQLMEQICNRGATAVDHLWPVLPSHALIEAKLRQMLPDRIHVLRRMLRDGPWPGHGAKVMAALEFPPLPSRQTHPSTVPSLQNHPAAVLPVQDGTVGHLPCSVNSPSQQQHMVSRQNPSSSQMASSRQNTPATLASPPLPTESVVAAPSIDSAAQARLGPSAPAAVRQIKTTRKVSWETDSSQSASSSMASCNLSDIPALSDIDVKIAVLAKWGQPLPQLPAQAVGESSSRKAVDASRKVTLRPLLKKNKRQAVPQGVLPQGLTGVTTQSSSSAMSASPTASAAASTIQASDSMHNPAPLDKLSSTLVQASAAASAVVPASYDPAQSPAVPQLIPSLPLQSPPAPQPVPMPANQMPARPQKPRPSHASFQVRLPAQSPLQMWPHVRKFNVSEPLKATPLPIPKKPQDPGKAPGGQTKVAQAGTPSRSRVSCTDKTLARSSVQSQLPDPAIPSGQPLSLDASPDLSSGLSQSLGVSPVTTLSQRQSQAEPAATASGRLCSSTAAPAPGLGRNQSPAASRAAASGQQLAPSSSPASSPATPSRHPPLSSSVMSPATCSGQQQVTAVSPAVSPRHRQSPPASPPARQAMLLSPEQPSTPPRPDLPPQGHPTPSPTAVCQSGQRQQAPQLQNREHSCLTDTESATEAQDILPGLSICAALSPSPILRSSPTLRSPTAPHCSLPQLASELPMSSQQQGGSPGPPQTPLPSRTLRHVRCQNASEMPLRPDAIRHLQSQRANRIMHASPSLPDIGVRPETSGQVQNPEWLLQAGSRHDVWQTPQVASNWSAKGTEAEARMCTCFAYPVSA